MIILKSMYSSINEDKGIEVSLIEKIARRGKKIVFNLHDMTEQVWYFPSKIDAQKEMNRLKDVFLWLSKRKKNKKKLKKTFEVF